MSIKDTFATKLKEVREAAELTQSQLAEKLNVSRGSISFYENGDRTPDIVFAEALADLFGIPIEYLFGYTENKVIENVKIGYEFDFSDETISVLKEGLFNTTLNKIIENKYYYDLMRIVAKYINSKESDRDQDEYFAFLISKIFIELLRDVKLSIKYKNYTEEDFKKSSNDFNKSIEQYKKMTEEFEEKWEQRIIEEQKENADEINMRKKVLGKLKLWNF